MIQGKVWGETRPIFNKNGVEIHRMVAYDGGYCSKHRHNFKYNEFFVESGKLEIEVWQKDYDLIDKTLVESGEKTVVPPGLWHRFRALEDTVCFEIYYTELDPKDIEREDHGGTDSSY